MRRVLRASRDAKGDSAANDPAAEQVGYAIELDILARPPFAKATESRPDCGGRDGTLWY